MDDQSRQKLALGKELYERQEYDKAEPHLREVIKEHPNFADVHSMLGVIEHAHGHLEQAQASFEAALRINPAYTEAALNLAVTYNDLGKYAEAKEIYGKALQASNDAPRRLDRFACGKLANMHAGTGDAYLGFNLFDEAAREYRMALGLCPDFADLRTKLAQALRDAGNLEEAALELEAAKKFNPNYMPARINLGLVLYSLGRKSEAAREWEAVLIDEPGNQRCKLYLRMVKE